MRAARDAFSKIGALEPEEHNGVLIALGYYGSFCCFTAINDSANAFRYVYECTKKYPGLALQMFPPDFYSKNYRVEIPEVEEKLAALNAKHAREENRLLAETKSKTSAQIADAMRTGKPLQIQRVEEADVQAHMRLRELEGDMRRAAMALAGLRKELDDECDGWLKALKRDKIGTLKLDHFRKLIEG